MTELIYADLTYQVRGALYEVYNELRQHPLSEAGWEKALKIALEDKALVADSQNELGPGFMHMHYRRATQIELRLHDISYEIKKEIVIQFRQQPIETYETYLMIVDNKILLACVAVREVTTTLKGRFRRYLELLKLELGLIANFHATKLEIETIRI